MLEIYPGDTPYKYSISRGFGNKIVRSRIRLFDQFSIALPTQITQPQSRDSSN
ncbi:MULTISPECIES: hypothetical protein [unclassified Microcoleus]|uniref:hypothetical protein n=1 Tax=unclassified Microcoleus TaxID=2642155 RepID=UPI0025D8249E|nr:MULTISPECIES: hypothetical protein [unclassified Microcoleus]